VLVPNGQPGYNPKHYEDLIAVEDKHFWFRVRNQILSNLLRQISDQLKPGFSILEVGCGTGNVLRYIERVCDPGKALGMDLFFEGLQYARKRVACSLIQGDILHSCFRKCFEVICLFDVLEHIENDEDILKRIHDITTVNGFLVITVPAYPSLWSSYDVVAHHVRRYTLSGLREKVIRSGYRIEYMTHFFTFLWPFIKLIRSMESWANCKKTNVEIFQSRQFNGGSLIMPALHEIIYRILAVEGYLIARRKKLLLGTSLLVVARRI